jgi:uncharacterized membrane protein
MVEVKGIYRISRHALFLSFAFLGAGNLFLRGALSDILFWGSFPAFWTVGSMHQDSRLEKTLPKSFYEQTSLLPFQAVWEGRQDLKVALKEMDGRAVAIALISPIFFL